MKHPLLGIPDAWHRGEHLGMTSVCSAHPLVIEAALGLARERGRTVLIEATCNQVNQDGGYTGMTPAEFRQSVEDIAAKVQFDATKIVLGGDHLGPNPWKHLPASEAMEKAKGMIRAYVEAGFTKLHLDTSMGCKGEPVAPPGASVARRAASLAAAAERHKRRLDPVYVIGTEVPAPGGANHRLDRLEPTRPVAVTETLDLHRAAFREIGLQDAFSRVIALVVQPGVEFTNSNVIHFDTRKAQALSAALKAHPGLVFEAHSTDFQTIDGLRGLVENGFAFLKVGPSLTFVLREALYSLDGLADVLDGHAPKGRLMRTMERAMQEAPDNWLNYCSGSERDLWLQRHFGLSDRIRYYWPVEAASEAVAALLQRLKDRHVPVSVRNQFFPDYGLEKGPATGHALLINSVKNVLRLYEDVTGGRGKTPRVRHTSGGVPIRGR